ncbi:unnamed protein product [Cylindrotheca closterium]|uniref:CSC1/OSCA1-like cytosolic domain-containing protein n=1 Tax=Cylindrotheca closterium TaxID=2856 RepID=A0AAD2GCZ3_9STRA|nr:unnamed protein product [Cylindrotheca closterium]
MMSFLWPWSSSATGDHENDENPSENTPLHPSASDSNLEDIPEPQIDFLEDDEKEMTMGRRLALKFMDKSWYNPQAKDKTSTRYDLDVPNRMRSEDLGPPSLEKAWAYFEHFSLNRYISDDSAGIQNGKKSEPGHNQLNTKLYHPITTPHKDLGDFGLGVGLYFSILRYVSILTLICGLISIGNIRFFDSDYYLPESYRSHLPISLRGSATCTKTSWVPCTNCECVPEGIRLTAEELRNSPYLPAARCKVENNVTHALRNECGEIPLRVGLTHLTTVVVFLVALFSLGKFIVHETNYFDEDEQTAQDYSIRISNPPKTAIDPDQWYDFFYKNFNAKAAVVTCAVENDLLIKTLVERRECTRLIEMALGPEESTEDNNLAKIAAKIERDRNALDRWIARISAGMPELYSRLVTLDAKVKGLAQLDYHVTNVFVTFETEEDQRRVLSELSVGFWQSQINDRKAVPKEYLFDGERVLYVSEPDEPSAIRWQDLNVSYLKVVKLMIFSHMLSLISIVAVFFFIRYVDSHFSSVKVVSYTISIINSLFPYVAEALTGIEQYPAAGAVETSLFFKIAMFTSINTAIVLTMITPFTATLDDNQDGIIYKVSYLFWSEIVTTTLLQLADVSGHIKRHVLAPRAKTQDAMNLMFQGTVWRLAERYTNLIKFVLLCVWFCSIFPAAFFLCSISLGLKYYLDRFSLMRTWQRAPHFGTRVARASHAFFFPLIVVAMVVMGTVYWNGFPYDNICPANVEKGKYKYCYQDFRHAVRAHEYMDASQRTTERIFELASTIIFLIVSVKMIWQVLSGYKALYSSVYQPVGAHKTIPFSDLHIRSAYIPGVVSPLFAFPLIACHTESIDAELFDWRDPDHPHSFYDLSDDADKLLKHSALSDRGFSHIKCFKRRNSLYRYNSNDIVRERSSSDSSFEDWY